MPQIVDQFGKPIMRKTLDVPQTARLVHLHREVAQHPTRGLTPAGLNAILERAEHGDPLAQHELMRDMEERDGHVFSELSKRKRAVIKLPWDIVPPRNPSRQEEAACAYVKELLLDMHDLEDWMFDALDAIAHGFAALEFEWQRVGGHWLVVQCHHRPQSWFHFDRATRTHLRLRDASHEGQALRPFGWMVHVHKAISGYTVRSGLGRVLLWPYLFKHFSVGDLAEFLDIYGLPLRIGKYPGNASDQEKATLWRAVAGIGHNAAGIIPASMAIEFEEAARGSEKPFEAMIRWCEQTQSRAILGSTLTSTGEATGLGSGVAQIHNEVRLDIRDSDCKQLAGTITRCLIYPLLAINLGWEDFHRCPRMVFDTTQGEDIHTYAQALPQLVHIGMKIPAQWAHERLRIPQPASQDEAVLCLPQPVQPQAGTAASQAALRTQTAVAAPAAAPAEGFGDQAVLDAALRQQATVLGAQAAQWLAPTLEALRGAQGSQQALAMLDAAMQGMQGMQDRPHDAPQGGTLHPDAALLGQALAQTLFVADVLGQDAVRQEVLA